MKYQTSQLKSIRREPRTTSADGPSTHPVTLVEYGCDFDLTATRVQSATFSNYKETNEPTMAQIDDTTYLIRNKHWYAIPTPSHHPKSLLIIG